MRCTSSCSASWFGKFQEALKVDDRDVIERCLDAVAHSICDPERDEGYLREGNVAVAQFEIERA